MFVINFCSVAWRTLDVVGRATSSDARNWIDLGCRLDKTGLVPGLTLVNTCQEVVSIRMANNWGKFAEVETPYIQLQGHSESLHSILYP